MRFSLKVICDSNIVETITQRVEKLTDSLGVGGVSVFLPYWKDSSCAIWEISATIKNPDYEKIQKHLLSISGASSLTVNSSSEDWECTHFVSIDELHSGKDIAFVVCNIF